MLTINPTTCKDCQNLQNLLCQIDDKLAIYAKKAYNKLTLMVGCDNNTAAIGTLLNYKRIVTHRLYDCDYALEAMCTCSSSPACDACTTTFSIEDIISRVKILLNK